jgi:hypothetical protein
MVVVTGVEESLADELKRAADRVWSLDPTGEHRLKNFPALNCGGKTWLETERVGLLLRASRQDRPAVRTDVKSTFQEDTLTLDRLGFPLTLSRAARRLSAVDLRE